MALDKITSITGPASELNAQYQTALAQTQTILDGMSTNIVGGTLYESYGDSITLATQVGVTNGGFRTLLATQNNWTNTNHAVSGDQALDQSLIAVQKTITDSDDQRFTLMVGYNDQRLYLGSAALRGFFRRYLGATMAWLTIPNNRKLFGTDLTNMPETGAGWANDAVIGRRTNVAGATKSFTVIGREIYLISILHDDPGAGTATITIDGVSYGTMSSLGTGTTSLNGHKFAPALYRFGGLDDTAHSVVITIDGTGYFYIEWAAGNSGLPMLHGPQLWVGGITRGSATAYAASGGSDALVGEYNDEIVKAVTELSGDGLAVKYVQTSFLDPAADTLDGIHPNDGGHVKLANAFESRINSIDSSPVLTGSNVALSNLESTAINTDLLVGVADGAALGSLLKPWSDLYLALGAVIDFNNSDIVLTHSNNKLTLSGGTFSIPDDPYDAGTWNGNTDAPTKNAVRDKIESLGGGGGSGASTALDNLASVAINTSLLAGTDNAIDLGSTSKYWRDVFVKGNLKSRDTSAAFDALLAFTSSTALTANRTLTIDMVNAARTLKLSGNPTIADWFDQSIKTTASPTFATLTLTAALAVAQGGTGATTASGARANLGAAASGANSDITNLTGLTGAVQIASQNRFRYLQSMARATNASGTQTINSGTITVVTFATEDYDTDGIHSTSSNTGRMTAAIAGKHRITGGVLWSAQTLGTTTVVAIFLTLNGTVIPGSRQYQAPITSFATFGQGIAVSAEVNLAAGDYVELNAYHDRTASGTLTIDAASSALSMEYIGE